LAFSYAKPLLVLWIYNRNISPHYPVVMSRKVPLLKLQGSASLLRRLLLLMMMMMMMMATAKMMSSHDISAGVDLQ